MNTINEVRDRFKKCLLEYTGVYETLDEEDPNAMGGDPSMGGGDPNAMGGDPSMGGGDPNAMGGDPSMGGGDPSMGGGDPNAMGGGDPNAMGGDPSMGGGDPNAMGGGEAQSPEGFAPQGINQDTGLDGMGGGDPNAMGGQGSENGEVGPDDDVVEIDDLTDSQEETEKKVDALASKFEKLMSSLDGIEKRINDIDAHTNQYLGSIKGEIEKRNPTPMQRLTMRSTKSAPYGMTPNEYMNNYAPENYSDESDNNGADDQQYKITKGDIDDITDYQSIANDIRNNKLSLNDIFDF